MHSPGEFGARRWRCYISPKVQQVLVLNSGYEPLNVCTVRRAYVLVFKGRAEVIEKHAQPLRSASDTFQRPHVIRLLTYVHVPRRAKRKISRPVLFARDGWRCGYCGSSTNKLTLDHIVPRSRGGESVWENVVASCAPCNRRKGDRLLTAVSYTHLRAHETVLDLVCRLLLEKKKKQTKKHLKKQ